MIRHLLHAEIDKQRWDAMLLACPNRLWYAQSWVLDIAAPDWGALVDESVGALMPLTWRRKWGIDYLFQPLGLQQLGAFAPTMDAALAQRFLDAIPQRFRYADIQLNESMHVQPSVHDTLQVKENQLIPLQHPLDQIRAGYAKGHRRNLREAGAGLQAGSIGVQRFAELFRSTTGARYGPDALRGFDVFTQVMQEGVRRGQCEVSALLRNGEPVAAACFATWEGRTILLKSANTAHGLEAKAMFRVVDDWIARHAGSERLFDLAGSSTPSVARFNAGFGAESRVYLRLVRNRLPAPLRWLKR